MMAKEIIAGMNQLNGRKILILDLVSSDIQKNHIDKSWVNISVTERNLCSVTYIYLTLKEFFYIFDLIYMD